MEATSDGCPSRRTCFKSKNTPTTLTSITLRNVASDARAAFGQQPNRRDSDESGRAGDDGDLAIQTNSIGHGFPLGSSG